MGKLWCSNGSSGSSRRYGSGSFLLVPNKGILAKDYDCLNFFGRGPVFVLIPVTVGWSTMAS